MRAALFASFLLVSSSASAQTIERMVSLFDLGWGGITATPIDADANPLTEEWLIARPTEATTDPDGTTEYRVVAICRGALIAADWFTLGTTQPATLGTLRGRSKLITQGTDAGSVSEPLIVFSLDMPAACTY